MTILNEPELLRNLKPYDSLLYQDIDLTGLTVFALHFLQSNHIPATFENVTVALFRLFPTKFALIGFSQYPDATRVNRSLLQLRPKYRNWATGKVVTGYTLTDSGLKKLDEVKQALTGAPPRNAVPTKVATVNLDRDDISKRTLNLSKELENIEESPLYQKWKNGQLAEATTFDFLVLLGAYSYTPARAIRSRVSRLTEIATQYQRGDIVAFFKQLRERFGAKFEDKKGE